MQGYMAAGSVLKTRYEVLITDTPYIINEATQKKTEGVPSISTEVREETMTALDLYQILTGKFACPVSGSSVDLSAHKEGAEIAEEFSDGDDMRHEVSVASPMALYDPVSGTYSRLTAMETAAVPSWKKIVCMGGRRITLSKGACVSAFREGAFFADAITPGSVILCAEGGDLTLAVVLLAEDIVSTAAGYAVSTSSGVVEASGVSLL